MEYLKLGNTKEVLPGEMKQFNMNGKELMVINLAGRFYCLDARCTHAGGLLAEGTLSGDVVTCPRHRSRFKVTDGSVVGGPARNPLGTYKVVVKDDLLLIEAAA